MKSTSLITLDESDFLGAFIETLLIRGPESIPVGVFVLIFQLVALQKLDHNSLVFDFRFCCCLARAAAPGLSIPFV